MDDEVIGSYGEIADFDINTQFFAQLLAFRISLIVRTPCSMKLQSSMYADTAALL
jgi:hypothetical protein